MASTPKQGPPVTDNEFLDSFPGLRRQAGPVRPAVPRPADRSQRMGDASRYRQRRADYGVGRKPGEGSSPLSEAAS
jgi:hypothetical protein